MKQKQKAAIYLIILALIGIAKSVKASTFLECSSRDVKSCTKEISKGEAIRLSATNSKAVIVKVDFVKLNDKGTLSNDNK